MADVSLFDLRAHLFDAAEALFINHDFRSGSVGRPAQTDSERGHGEPFDKARHVVPPRYCSAAKS
jgi:hypothetical protein